MSEKVFRMNTKMINREIFNKVRSFKNFILIIRIRELSVENLSFVPVLHSLHLLLHFKAKVNLQNFHKSLLQLNWSFRQLLSLY